MPVATEHLLFAPMPLTGDWVLDVLHSCGGADVPKLPKFSPLAEIPDSWRDERAVFGTIRDPWSWYQALWQAMSTDRDGQVLLRFLGQGSTAFPAFLRGVTDSSVWLGAPVRLTGRLWDWPATTDDGLYTATVRTFYDQGTPFEGLLDYAQIELGLSEVLGVPVQGSRPDTLGCTYSASMQAHVQQTDGELAELIGYDRPSGKLPRPVRRGGVS